ncbi:MAG: hypothetical protein HC877_02225 [Thioploca sp.]|nr:hypothetical protein [Thioploca sp.]
MNITKISLVTNTKETQMVLKFSEAEQKTHFNYCKGIFIDNRIWKTLFRPLTMTFLLAGLFTEGSTDVRFLESIERSETHLVFRLPTTVGSKYHKLDI